MFKPTYYIYSPDQYTSSPWRNGQGETTQLLSESINGSGEFAWRLSKARVDVDGPFSNFLGYDRTLVLFAGNGAQLSHDSGQDTLDQRFNMARFGGDANTQSTLINGPVINFNIMTRQNTCYADVQVLTTSEIPSAQAGADITLIYACDQAIKVLIAGGLVSIPKDHLLKVQGRGDIKHMDGTGIYCHIFYVSQTAQAAS